MNRILIYSAGYEESSGLKFININQSLADIRCDTCLIHDTN